MWLNQGPNDDVDGHEKNKIQWYQYNWGDLIEKYVYNQERSKLNNSLASPPQWRWVAWFSVIPWGQQTRFVKNTIQYDSKSKHSKRRQTVNWTWEVACWFSFSLFLKISAVTYTTACTRVRFSFWKASAYDFFVEKLYGMRARALAVHACPRARGAARDGSCSLGHSEAAPQSGQMSCGQ